MKNEKLSVSGLKEFSKSLQHYLDYKNRIQSSSDAMRFGTALHTAVLEPEKFNEEICVLDEIPSIKQIKKGWPKAASMKKMWFEVTLLLESPKTVITAEQLEMIKSMHVAIFKHPVASQLIAKGKEKEIWLKGKLPCNHGDIDIHGKADVVHDGKAKICIDLKTIADATIDKIVSKMVIELPSHQYFVNRREAIEIGLSIIDMDEKTENVSFGIINYYREESRMDETGI